MDSNNPKISPLLPVSEFGRVEIITIYQSDTITQKSEVRQRRTFENVKAPSTGFVIILSSSMNQGNFECFFPFFL